MNRRLIDPFQSLQLPEIIEEYLDQGITTCLAFNRRGTILAAGTKDGAVNLWDWETRGIASTLMGHEGSITSICWSRNGRYLVSGCNRGQVILWDVVKATAESQIQLPAGCTRVSISRKAPYYCVASMSEGPPVVVHFESNQQQPIPMITESDFASKANNNGVATAAPGGVAVLTKKGDMIIVGYSKGGIMTVLDSTTLGFLDVIKVPNAARVLGLTLNRQGTYLLANCHDRTVRLFEVAARSQVESQAAGMCGGLQTSVTTPAGVTLPTLETVQAKLKSVEYKSAKPGSVLWGPSGGLLTPVRDISNAVDRCSWTDACFTSDCEHIVTGATSKLSHHIYIWSRLYGNMERILEGPKEGMGPLAWHPLRSCLCSVTWPSGKVYVWARAYAEQWSAFAPDFKELDENVEYVEQEDEFDWATPGATGNHERLVEAAKASSAAEAAAAESGGGSTEPVDVLTMPPDWVFSSDEEDEPGDQLHYLPVVIQEEVIPPPEEEEQPPQQQLEQLDQQEATPEVGLGGLQGEDKQELMVLDQGNGLLPPFGTMPLHQPVMTGVDNLQSNPSIQMLPGLMPSAAALMLNSMYVAPDQGPGSMYIG